MVRTAPHRGPAIMPRIRKASKTLELAVMLLDDVYATSSSGWTDEQVVELENALAELIVAGADIEAAYDAANQDYENCLMERGEL